MEDENIGQDPNAGAAAVAEPEATPEQSAEAQPQAESDIQPGKTYTDKQVQEIVQKRLKAWQEFGKPEEVRTRLTRQQELERLVEELRGKFSQGGKPAQAGDQPQLTEDDKKVRSYLERVAPEVFQYQRERQNLMASLQSFNNWQWQQISERNSNLLRGMAEKEGYQADHMAQLEEHVKNSIIGNQEDFKKYLQTADPGIVKKHFDAINKWIKSQSFAPPTAPAAAAAKAGAKKAALPPRMPSGGVSAPTSANKKMTDAERVTAAFAAFSKGNA